MKMNDLDSNLDRVSVPENVLLQKLGDESVLLDVATGASFGLDPVGTRCWELLSASGSINKAIEGIVAEYDVEPKRARQELDALVQELINNGLLKSGF
jgi:hypothetical protein